LKSISARDASEGLRTMTAPAFAANETPRAVTPVLEALALKAGYQHRQVLYDVNLSVGAGEIVALLGHNGAGKTTLLKTIIGFIPLFGGRIWFNGKDRTADSYTAKVRAGMSYTSAEAPVFRDLTVRDNLELGGFTVADAQERSRRMRQVFALFQILEERQGQLGGTLSGGQQRMLSLGMAIMAKPKLMLLDEPSLGLSPAIVQSIFQQIRQFAAEDGTSVLLIEQNVRAALRIADRAYFMRSGEIILEQDSETALARGSWWDLF
jgi:branched-chain amino acid transport system ATP-binding protein